MPTLTHKRNDSGDRQFEVSTKPLVIGRVGESDIVVRDSFVSRVHAGVGFADNQFTLKDLGSTNGTYRNGARVFQCALNTGDKIQVGNTTLVFELDVTGNAVLRQVPQMVAPPAPPPGGSAQPPGLKLTMPVKLPEPTSSNLPPGLRAK